MKKKFRVFNPERELLTNFTGVFRIDGCPHCALYDQFIEIMNQKLPPKERLESINCTFYHDYGYTSDPRIKIFIKYYEGSYPSLFIKGELISGANSVEELYARVIPYFMDKFVVAENLTAEADGKEHNLLFDKQCEFGKKGLFRKKLKCR